MQDGAPCHRRLDVKMFLSETFNNRVISVGHEVEWPPRSPDLTPFDFFLWGYLKDQVFKTTPTDLGELRTRITHHINVLKKNTTIIRRAMKKMRVKCLKCLDNNGGHV